MATAEEEEPLAESVYAFADKLLRGGLRPNWTTIGVIIVFMWAALIVWLFIQDNGRGELDNTQSLWWFWMKAQQISMVPIVLLVLTSIVAIISSLRSQFQRR